MIYFRSRPELNKYRLLSVKPKCSKRVLLVYASCLDGQCDYFSVHLLFVLTFVISNHGLRALTIVRDRLLHRSLITAESPQRSSFDLGDKHCQATSRLTG